MYKVIVADDEEIIRRGLVDKIAWNKYGFEVVGEAENGMDALELVEQLEPDLIITDIRMPFLSGIELAREIRQIRPMLSIVFLSGYDEFTYAQQAIEYNILSYLLKPITAEEFEEELKKIKFQMDEKFQGFTQNTGEIERLKKSEFLYPLLMDNRIAFSVSESELINEAIEHGFSEEIKNENIRFCVFVTQIKDENGNNRRLKYGAGAVDRIAGKYVYSMSCYLQDRVVSVAADTERNLDKFINILTEEILQSVERFLQLKCNIGVSRKVDTLLKCKECYLDATNAMYYAINNESNVFFIGDEENVHRYSHDELKHIEEKMDRILRGGSAEELSEYLEKIEEVGMTGKMPGVVFRHIVSVIISTIYDVLYAVAGEEAVEKLQNHYSIDRINYPEITIFEFERVKALCMAAKNVIVEKRRESSNNISRKVIELIDGEFANQQLSVQYASEKIGVSPNYLSTLIKKETGKSFVSLITNRRIENACSLLQKTDLKVKDVAEKCGYTDQYYFSHCFKKVTGKTPGAYRREC